MGTCRHSAPAAHALGEPNRSKQPALLERRFDEAREQRVGIERLRFAPLTEQAVKVLKDWEKQN